MNRMEDIFPKACLSKHSSIPSVYSLSPFPYARSWKLWSKFALFIFTLLHKYAVTKAQVLHTLLQIIHFSRSASLSNTDRGTLLKSPSSYCLCLFASVESVIHPSARCLDLSSFFTHCLPWLLSVKGVFHSIIHLRSFFLSPSVNLTPEKFLFSLSLPSNQHLCVKRHFNLKSSETLGRSNFHFDSRLLVFLLPVYLGFSMITGCLKVQTAPSNISHRRDEIMWDNLESIVCGTWIEPRFALSNLMSAVVSLTFYFSLTLGGSFIHFSLPEDASRCHPISTHSVLPPWLNPLRSLHLCFSFL